MCTAMEIFKTRTESIGYEKGESVGFDRGQKVLIMNMHDSGLSIDEIVKYTNLNQEEVSPPLFRYST